MSEAVDCDVCIIGAGSAGLSAASGAAQLGMRTVLFERDAMGGDCLNYGCVPSKALLASAKAAADARGAARLGVKASEIAVDFKAVMSHVRRTIDAISPKDSVERFERLGVRVIKAEAKFVGPRDVTGGGFRVQARRFVIATGSTVRMPPIPGLGDVGALSNETIFSLDRCPAHIVILGGGATGIEMAQAFRKLGARVTLVELERILGSEEPEFVDMLRRVLIGEGIELREGTRVARVERDADVITVMLDGQAESLRATHLLVATGRKPRVESLDLEQAGVAFDDKGIAVDARLRTTNPRIYALGDVAGGPLFTHVAGYHAGLFVRNALFRLPSRVDYRAVPSVIYTDPELARVGLTEREAKEGSDKDPHVLKLDFTDNDRAQAEGATAGGIKVIARKNGTVIGASIMGRHAGELILPWTLLIARKLSLRALTDLLVPYPTLSEISKAAAGAFYAPKLFSAWPRRVVRGLSFFS